MPREVPPGRGDFSEEASRWNGKLSEAVGLDVDRDTAAACVRVPGSTGRRQQDVRTFGTTGAELLALRDWLQAHAITHVAMESTGVY